MNRPEITDTTPRPSNVCAYCGKPGTCVATVSEGAFGPREQVFCNPECAERAFAEHGCDREVTR